MDATEPAQTHRPGRPPKTMGVLGTPLLLTSYQRLAEQFREWKRFDGTTVIDFTNTQIVTMRRHDSAFRKLTARFDFYVPDGMPLIWCLNRQSAGLSDRVYGPSFMRYCLGARPGVGTHYLLGASPECLDRLRDRLMKSNPELQIIGMHHGYFNSDGDSQILDEINRLSPDVIWVGMGTPRQQSWIERNRNHIRRGLILAVGFAFDVNAGTKADAPAWMQRAGLTWLFRMVSEPRRLIPRYLKYNSLFLFYLMWDGLRGRAFAATSVNAPDESGIN